MKAVDEGRKIFYLFSTSGGGTSDVVDISFVQGRFCSRVLSEDLFLDMPHEQTCIIRSQTAPHRDPSCLPIKISIERECVQCKRAQVTSNLKFWFWSEHYITRTVNSCFLSTVEEAAASKRMEV